MHVIGTAGHVDHGKSTLVERLTGIDPDRFAEEKRRGLTIDLGFAWLTLPSGAEVGLVDVPGHERFIKNMLAGAGGISICLFVVAANEGWKPQSAEHLSILDILGVRSGVVAVTKRDLVETEALELALLEIRERLAGSVLHDAPLIACSAETGEGIAELIGELDRVVAMAPPVADLGRPRLWIDRVFTMSGAGTIVTGTLAGGSIRAGDDVEVSPEGRKARVRAIQSHKKEVTHVAPGTRVALNLVGLERQGTERGDAVVSPRQWQATRKVDAMVEVLPARITGRSHKLTEKGAHLLYVGSAETPVRVRLLERDEIPPGERGLARLFLRDALPLARGDRFVLRDAGRVLTFGGGEVLDPLPSGPGDPSFLDRLVGARPDEALVALVNAEGSVAIADAMVRTGARSASGAGGLAQLDSVLVSEAHLAGLVRTVRDALGTYHREHPLERGMPKEELRALSGLGPRAFEALLATEAQVVEEGATVRLLEHSSALPASQQPLRDKLVARIEAGGMSPPMSAELGADPTLLRALVDRGDLVRIGDFYLTADGARRVRSQVRSAIEQLGPLTVAEIRDLLGTSRKYAVPLCEWLDSTGATLRKGDLRHLGPRA